MSLRALKNQTITNKSLSVNVTGSTDSAIPVPVISSVIICDSSYNNLDDTALNPSGGYAKIIGTGFKSGCAVFLNNQSLTTYYISSTEVRIETPSITVGAYNLMLFNSNNEGGAIYLNLSVSNFPTWSTSAGSIGSEYEQKAYASSVVASGDTPLTYSLYSGSLPDGITLSSDGTLSGTTPAEAGSTTYTFVANVKDAQGQDSTRTFTLTINVDVVTWSSPSQNYIISSYEYAPISNVTLSATAASGYGVLYSPNTLPTGITTNTQSGLVSGTINTIGNYYTRYTATANTTGRSVTRDVVFNVNQDSVTWSNPAEATTYTLNGGSAMSNVTLSATSAAGFGVQYTANALPSGVSLSNNIIYGTPDTAQTVNTLLTATAATTNRSATRNISWTITLGDTYWKYTTLLLNPIASANTFINDASVNNNQLIIAGDTKQSNFSPYTSDGYYSQNFTGGAGTVVSFSGSTLAIGTNDYTIEFWIYPVGTGFQRYLDFRAAGVNGPLIYYTGTLFGYSAETPTGNFAFEVAIKIGAWTHVAVSRISGTTRMWFNGVAVTAATASAGTLTAASTCYLGGQYNSANYANAYLSNLRIVKGTGLYNPANSTITVPTEPLTAVANTVLLTCASSKLIDKSLSKLTLSSSTTTGVRNTPFANPSVVSYNTQYSTYFDGSGDYLQTGATSPILGSGDFTLECWIYPNALGAIKAIYGWRNGADTSVQLLLDASNRPTFGGDITNWLVSSTSVVLSKWYHIAIVRNGSGSNNMKMYLDGVEVATATNTTNFTWGSGVNFGIFNGATPYTFSGYISNLRLVVGSAVYPSSFTPPTSPLTAIANTKLLICQSTTIKDNGPDAVTITSAGQAQPVAVSPFTMTTSTFNTSNLGSTYFDGTGDYLSLSNNTGLALGTSDFTIQFWTYFATAPAADVMIYEGRNGAQGVYPLIYWKNSTAQIVYYVSTGDRITTSMTAASLAGRWTHFALSRASSVTRLFIDGVQVGSNYADTNNYLNSGNYPMINSSYTAGTGTGNLYIADLYVNKGTAHYTTNFLPPQAPLTVVANTQLLTCQTSVGATNNGFIDESISQNIITRNGNVNQGTFSPYNPTGWSAYFYGSNSSYISFAPTASTVIGTSAFTIESWVYITSYVHSCPVVNSRAYNTTGTGTWTLGIGTSGQVVFSSLQAPAADLITTSNGAVPLNTWTHIAMVRNSSNQLYIYINGVSSGTTTPTSTINFSSTNTAYIGYNPDSNLYSTSGYYSNLRIDKTAIYNGNFTPPTSPLTPNRTTVLLTCQTPTIVDNSPINVILTRSGDVSIQAYSPFDSIKSVPTSFSNYFDNNGDYLTVPSDVDFTFGTNDFTVEAWVYMTTYNAATYQPVFANSYLFYIGGVGQVLLYNGTTDVVTGTSGDVPINSWNHVAWVRSGTTVTIYVNGVSKATGTVSASIATANPNKIGNYSTVYFPGYISNLRVVNGTAIYTSTFTPSTTPLTTTSQGATASQVSLLTCQSNIMVDNSPNYFVLTAAGDVKPKPFNPFGVTNTKNVSYTPSLHGGSMYFDGTGDYLNVAGTMPVIGTSDFTFECWVYLTSAAANAFLIDFRPATTQGVYPTLYMYTNRAMYYYVSAADKINGSVGATENMLVSLNAWTHIAVCRRSGSTKLFVNGTQVGSTYADTNSYLSPATRPFIGSNSYTASTMIPIGYISDYNLTVNAAKYTSNFTPPYSPVTTTTTVGANTYQSSLYLTGTSGGIIDQRGSLNFETVGNTQLASESPYEGVYYSNYFDGTGDYLSVPVSAGLSFGTGDFTVECWVYYPPISNTNGKTVLDSRPTSTNGSYWVLGTNNTGVMSFTTMTTGGTTVADTIARNNQWVHYAVVRQGTSLKLFVNGTLVASATDSSNISSSGLRIGMNAFGSVATDTYWLGNISNVRVVKGTALYTTNFTPSTSPLTTTSESATASQVSLLTCQSNDFKDNSINNLSITKTGDTKVKSFNPFKKNTGNSLSFDGTGDYLTCGNYTQFSVYGDFTLEMWVYLNTYSAATYWGLIDVRQTSVYTTGWTTYIKDNRIWFSINNTDIIVPTTGTQMNSGAWNHVAIVRSGSTITTYLNGVAQHTATNSAASVASTATIGYKSTTTSSITYLNGYLKDFRLTRGVARYTTTFTPPTSFETK